MGSAPSIRAAPQRSSGCDKAAAGHDAGGGVVMRIDMSEISDISSRMENDGGPGGRRAGARSAGANERRLTPRRPPDDAVGDPWVATIPSPRPHGRKRS